MAFARYADTADNLKSRAAYRTALSAIAARENAAVAELLRLRQSSHGHASLRRRALYLAVIAFNLSGRAVGRASGLSEKEVRKALRSVEEAREDPGLDRLLDEIELEIMA